MPFETLIKKPAPESELLDQLIAEIRTNYFRYQEQSFFMKLSKCGENSSEIVWIKIFKDVHDLGDFYYDTVMERACILLKFHDGRYEILSRGFFATDRFEIWPNKIVGRDPLPVPGTWNVEESRAAPRELLEKGFGEISAALKATKRNVGA